MATTSETTSEVIFDIDLPGQKAVDAYIVKMKKLSKNARTLRTYPRRVPVANWMTRRRSRD